VLFRSKQETDAAYNEALKFCFENRDKVALFAGSHNATSMEIGAELFKSTGRTSFFMTSQLQGMCDYITFNLASANIPASKYIPFGPANKALPYLIRRAEENSSILGETKKELALIEEEIKRREKVS
jgi:proline dehydrogenase